MDSIKYAIMLLMMTCKKYNDQRMLRIQVWKYTYQNYIHEHKQRKQTAKS
jgi:hypothetical protein